MGSGASREQHFVDSYLDRAVAEFGYSHMAVQLLRRLIKDFPDEFTRSAMRYLDSGDDSPAHRFLTIMMLRQPAVFDQMANPGLRSTGHATRLLRRFLEVDPSFDVQLARQLPDRTGLNHATAFDGVRVNRALDVLDETSRGRRLLPILGHLPDSDDPKISSRAVLFIGRRLQSPAWAEKQLKRGDDRARANAVEGLWGLDSPDATNLLQWCTDDKSSRVVGNALVGLSIAGKRGIREEVERLARRQQEAFRSTAAWTMGKLGDPAFLDPLRQLVRDDSPIVRGAALRAMIGIRRVEAFAADMAALSAAQRPAEAIPAGLEPAPAVPIELRLDGSSFSYQRRD